jgi:hypothetical protein
MPPGGYIPTPVARGIASLGDRLPSDWQRLAPLTSERLAFLTHSRSYDVSKAHRLLGFKAATGLRSGAAAAIAWYQDEGLLPARRTASPDRDGFDRHFNGHFNGHFNRHACDATVPDVHAHLSQAQG